MSVLIGLGLLALISVLSLSPEQRAAARARSRRLDWLWYSIIVGGLGFILWPRG